VKQPKSAAEVVLVLYLAALLVIWCAAVVSVIALVIAGAGSGGWPIGILLVGLAAVVTLAVVGLARRNWRLAVQRPAPDRGLGGWLARQPGPRLAVVIWGFYAVVALTIGLAVSSYTPGGLPWRVVPTLLIVAAFPAVGQAAQARVLSQRRQRRDRKENAHGLLVASPDQAADLQLHEQSG
jgi:hypothetical protein